MPETIQLPTPAHIAPAWLARPVHSPERRSFSVLCWRGWCDHEFKIRSIAALIEGVSGQPAPLPTHLKRKECPTPFTCECECHDEMRAAMNGTEVTAHAEAAYSPRQGFGAGHAVLDKPLTAGRFTRQSGEALCKPARKLWGPSARGSKVECPDCLTRAQRYGVMLP